MTVADDEYMETGWPELMEEFGAPIIYTPATGDLVNLTGLVNHLEDIEQPTQDGEERIRTCEVSISKDPAGEYGGVADPQENATMTVAGEVWPVRRVHHKSGYATLRCQIREAIEVSRPQYRRAGS